MQARVRHSLFLHLSDCGFVSGLCSLKGVLHSRILRNYVSINHLGKCIFDNLFIGQSTAKISAPFVFINKYAEQKLQL